MLTPTVLGIHAQLVKEVNDRAVELSVGETQKLLMARAIYKDAPILILDEPTSVLDPIAESKVYEDYNFLTSGKTALFISHRLASTLFCDRIILMENGKIAECGSHKEYIGCTVSVNGVRNIRSYDYFFCIFSLFRCTFE
ncbi:MAG TPA: hypothetical protein DD426_00190 [Clostridiaceae bacterium]|nr:hypothetical protein [Clostridiaceae bacterium]